MNRPVEFGIDQLLRDKIDIIEGKRIGLVTNHTGITSSLCSTVDVLHCHPKIRLTSLFGPEHGIRGDVQDGSSIGSFTDSRTGVPVYSLYGEHYRPTPDMLRDIDALVFDIQDVGARFYTYIATMNRCMKAAAELDLGFIVLDRPNPINGLTVEGNLLRENYQSFVGERPIPIRYGMTMGELATMFNEWFGINCELSVIRAEGWRRDMWYDDTGLPWVAPSPNMPTLQTATVYPGTCLIEGINVSEGRGTTRPFEMIGAPWIDGFRLCDRMVKWGLPGVAFRTIRFKPMFGKYAKEVCGGVQLHVYDRNSYRTVLTGLTLIKAIMDLFRDKMEFRRGKTDKDYSFDLLAGTDEIRKGLVENRDPEEIAKDWEGDLKEFLSNRKRYLLYP